MLKHIQLTPHLRRDLRWVPGNELGSQSQHRLPVHQQERKSVDESKWMWNNGERVVCYLIVVQKYHLRNYQTWKDPYRIQFFFFHFIDRNLCQRVAGNWQRLYNWLMADSVLEPKTSISQFNVCSALAPTEGGHFCDKQDLILEDLSHSNLHSWVLIKQDDGISDWSMNVWETGRYSLQLRFQAYIYLLISVLNPCGLCLDYIAITQSGTAGILLS